MPMFSQNSLQTIAVAYQEIRDGEEPWVALGNFMNDWFIYAPHRRTELVTDAPTTPEEPTLAEQRWATFMAASVEYLCQRSALPCPTWVYEKQYYLDTPWYHALYAHEKVRTWLEATTPEPFKRRNIYCGDRVYLDKREILSYPDSLPASPFSGEVRDS